LQDNHTDPAMCPAAWLTRGRTWYSKVFRCWLNLAAHRWANVCCWRNKRLQPETAFLRLPSVHRAGPEGQQRGRGRSIAERMGSLQDGEEYDHPAFALVLKLVDKGRAWVKLSGAYRDTRTGPPTYADVSRVARAYVNASPERMVWGASGRIRPKRPTPSPTTQFCSTSWRTGRLTKRRAVASWSTTRRRCSGSIPQEPLRNRS
jgi:hypothetical protein